MKCIDISPAVVNKYLTTQITLKALAKELGISDFTLGRRFKKMGVTVRQVPPTGIKYACNTQYFQTIDSEEKAYWLGFILAEGWLATEYDKRNTTTRLRFGIELSSVDHAHLVKFKTAVNSEAPISKRKRKSKNKITELSCIRIADKAFCTCFLQYFNVGKKSDNIRVPAIPDELLRHFVRGYFDGDGCIMKEGHLSFTSNSLGMLTDLQQIFSTHISTFTELPRMYKYKKCYKFIKSKFKALPIYEYMYQDATIMLDRKYNRYCQIFGLV